MGSFYGNIKNDQRISLIFDRIYPSRIAMEEALTQNKDENNAIQGDGVFINRYILIHYGYDIKKSEFYDQYDFLEDTSYTENDVFKDNCAQDLKKYHENYHLTIWMKIYSDNKEKYILVGHLKATPPSLTITPDAPNEDAPHMDIYESSDIVYNYHVPEMWNIDLNKQKDVDLENINIDSGDITDTNIIQYPYLNQEGFNPKYTHKDETKGRKNLIDIIEYKTEGKTYPDHVYTKIILTPNTYVKNQYYYLSAENNEDNIPNIIEEFIENPEYKNLQKAEQFDENQIYYQQTIRDKYYKITLSENSNFKDNTYYVYNGEKPPSIIEKNILNPNYTLKFDQSDTFDTTKTYYIKTQKINEDKTLSFSEKNNSKQISIQLPIIGNTISDLYDILYGKGTKDKNYERPYTNDFLFNYDGIMPYNNLTPEDNISMAWAIDELKSYISELRFLSHGQGWRLLGYTTENSSYSTEENDNTTHCIILYNNNNNKDRWLSNDQINALRPYNYKDGYIIPVYVADQNDSNAIGLQSDWILSDPKAFGYIYHKPRMLWSNSNYNNNSNITSKNPYYETLQSIEYIYNSIKLKENEIINKDNLFGKYDNLRDPILLGYTYSNKLQDYSTEQNDNGDLSECIIINSTTATIQWLSDNDIQALKQNFGDSIDSDNSTYICNIPVYKKI